MTQLTKETLGRTELEYDEVCGYFEPPHDQQLHDSWLSLEKEHPSRFEDMKFEQKLHQVLQEKGKARVYVIATSCGMGSPRRTQRKIEKWVAENRTQFQVTFIKISTHLDSRGEHFAPSVKAVVSSGREFKEMWKSLVKIPSSSCGCAVFVSDGQEIDVRVMDLNHISAGERLY